MIDNRMAQLIRALSAKQGGGGIGGGGRQLGGYGGALPTYGTAIGPRGLGGFFSNPIGFNPFSAQSGMGFSGLIGPSQGDPGAAQPGAAPAAVATPPGAAPDTSPLQGPSGGGAGGGSPAPSSTTPPTAPSAASNFYGSGDDQQAASSVRSADPTAGMLGNSAASQLMLHYLLGRDPFA